MTLSFRTSTAALVALALAAVTMAAQAQTSATAYVVPEPGVVVAGVAQAPTYADVYPAPVYAAPAYAAPGYAAPVAYVQAPAYYIDPVATALTAVGVGLLFGIGGHHGGPGPRRW